MADDRLSVLERACATLRAVGDSRAAEVVLRTGYPFEALAVGRRRFSSIEAVRIFARDGFVDRYSGARLVYPGTLRLLSHLMPSTFPFHTNWKRTSTHPAYWELYPTIDHVVPIARGGPEDPCPTNWVTTSMLRNSAKGDWMLDELGWQLHPPGDIGDWDGLMGWFDGFMKSAPELERVPALARWLRIAGRITTLGRSADR